MRHENAFGPFPINGDYNRECSPGKCLRDTILAHVVNLQEAGFSDRSTPDLIETFRTARREFDPEQQMCEPFERVPADVAEVTPKGCVYRNVCYASRSQVMNGQEPFPARPPQQWEPRQQPPRIVNVDHPGIPNEVARQVLDRPDEWRVI